MKKIRIIGIILLILVIIIAGLILLFPKKAGSYIVPEIQQIDDIEIIIKNDTVYIHSRFIAHNKSFFILTIDTIKYKIDLFNKTYLDDEQGLELRLSAYQTDTINFFIQLPYVTLLKDLKRERAKSDSAVYTLNASLQYSTIFGRVELPITKSAKIEIPQPPDFELMHISYKKVRFSHILADVYIKVTNHNDISLKLRDLSYNIDILKMGKMQGVYPKEISIKPKQETYIDLPLEISMKNVGKTVWDILVDKDNYFYTLTVNALVELPDTRQEPFHTSYIKEGTMELKK